MDTTDNGTTIKVEDQSNGQITTTQPPLTSVTIARRRVKRKKSWTSWLLSNISRIAIWYTIVTVLFRCPSDPKQLGPDDSRICRPYLALFSQIEPFVGPYYDRYAGPYVEKTKPYIDTANTRLVRPATVLASRSYQAFAAPQLGKVQAYAQSQWDKNAAPQLQRAQDTVQQVYDENLATYVQKASRAATPLYESARNNALNAHRNHLIPAIAYSQPHLQRGYHIFQRFVLGKVFPLVQHAWANVVIFLDGTLWPFVKKIHNDNVQPQLVMIGERIAKYQEGRKLQSVIDEIDSSSTTIANTPVVASTESTTTRTEASAPASSVQAVSSPPSQPATDDTITEDLVRWQKKFAAAADTGSADLKERIEEIVGSMLKSDLGEGQGLANALKMAADVELDAVKAKIKSVVTLLAEDANESETTAAESEVTQFIRNSGQKVKERAKAVRVWSDTFQRALSQRAELAGESTVQVLNNIRDLGLQEIGMRWAWMEGVTYKHWQKYHDLKKKFGDQTSEIRVTAQSHPAVIDAKIQAEELLNESMSFTEETAKELARLRAVAKWKTSSRDTTDDFDSRAIPVVAAAVSSASSAVVGLSNSASSVILGTTGTMESLASDASKTALSGLSEGSGVAEGIVSSASSAVIGSYPDSVESLASHLSNTASSLLTSATSSASSLAWSATAPPSEGVLSSVSSVVDSISLSASSAAADAEVSSRLKDAVSEAGEKATIITSSWLSGS